MTAGRIAKRLVGDRLAWVAAMVAEIQALPLGDRESFFADRRNIWTAESCLRRILEALFDLGRHFLAQGFGVGVSEYKEIARELGARGVVSAEVTETLVQMAGYRNRLVHIYHEVDADELYAVCIDHLADVTRAAGAIQEWLIARPDLMDDVL